MAAAEATAAEAVAEAWATLSHRAGSGTVAATMRGTGWRNLGPRPTGHRAVERADDCGDFCPEVPRKLFIHGLRDTGESWPAFGPHGIFRTDLGRRRAEVIALDAALIDSKLLLGVSLDGDMLVSRFRLPIQ